jgi:hypothetical protein
MAVRGMLVGAQILRVTIKNRYDFWAIRFTVLFCGVICFIIRIFVFIFRYLLIKSFSVEKNFMHVDPASAFMPPRAEERHDS